MIALWLGLSFAVAQDPGWDPVLHDEAYRFCNVPGAQAEDAREWCELLEEMPPERCPGLRATCEGAPAQDDMADVLEAIQGCGSGGGTGKGGFAAPPEPPASQPMSCEMGQMPEASAPMALMRWVGAIFAAIVVLVMLRLFWRWFGGRIDRPVTVGEPVAPAIAIDADEIPDLPSGDLLAEARRALAEGRTGDAVLLARGAALRRLGEVGRVRLHRARTDREYVRMLRQEPALQSPLREVVVAVETHRWGGRSISDELARAALSAAERLIAGATAVLLVLLALEEPAAASRYGPYGDAALYDLFGAGGYDVAWRLRGLASLDEHTDVLVLDLGDLELEEEDERAVRAWVEAGGLLVVGGDTSTLFPELGLVIVDYDEPADEQPSEDETTDDAVVPWGARGSQPWRGASAPHDLPIPLWPGGPYASFAYSDVALSLVQARFDQDVRSVVSVVQHGAGGVIGIADFRLLRNAALVLPENEAFLLAAPYAAHDLGVVELPLPARLELATRAGSDAENPWTSLANAKMLPVVLQLLAMGALVALWRGWPFAPLRDPPEEGRLRFTEHVRALGTRYARLGASRRALSMYASLWLGRLGPAGVEQAARRAGMSAEGARAFVRRLEAVAEDPDGPDQQDDLEELEELWRITQRL